MLNERLNKASRIGLVAVVLLYIIIVIMLVWFSDRILKDISAGNPVSNSIFIPILIIIPLLLFIIILYQVFRTIRSIRRKQSGARFRTKILIFFVIITLFSGIPQGILSINLISTAMTYWLAPDVKEALDGGVSIALQYYNGIIDNINSVIENPVLKRLAEDTPYTHQRVWAFLQQNYPSISSLQVFSHKNSPVYFSGDERGLLESAPGFSLDRGILPRNDYQALTVLRGIYSSGNYKYIFSSILKEDFNKTAESLTSSLESFSQMEKFKGTLRLVIFALFTLFSLPLILISLMLAFLLAEEIVAPVIYMENATKRVADGDYSFRILGRKNDELSFLVESFNQMISQIEKTRYQSMQTDKLEAWQEIAQRLAHEVKNPLTPIKLSAERILKKYQNNEDLSRSLPKAVSSIIREVENMDKLIQEFRDFSRTPTLYQKKESINSIIANIIASYGGIYPEVQIKWDQGNDYSPFIDSKQINRVLTNLVNNAAEAMKSYGLIHIRTDLVRKGNTEYCRIQVQDNGAGIPEEIHGQVFNPYFTTKENGTGLGLAIIERIVFDHAGSIWFESEKGTGTTFFIDLPMENQR